ncbi:MAG: transposase [Isosphaeraceae bacterium]
MERQHLVRLEQMLAQAEVSPELMQGLLKRLDAFVDPFAKSLAGPEQQRHAAEVADLLSSSSKTGEAIAYLHDQERQGLQKFVGHVPWDHEPLLETLARQVGEDLGAPDAVIVFDPSAFPKKGTKSVGVAAVVWPPGQGQNCQVGVFMAYVSEGTCGL